MPSKGQVSNPNRLRDTELSVYFLSLATVSEEFSSFAIDHKAWGKMVDGLAIKVIAGFKPYHSAMKWEKLTQY